MAKRYQDILLDANSDLIIKDGDLFLGDSLDQEVGLILTLNQGGWKSSPFLGPNLTSLMNTTNKELVKRRIKLNLELDNKQVGVIKYDGVSINIDAANK